MGPKNWMLMSNLMKIVLGAALLAGPLCAQALTVSVPDLKTGFVLRSGPGDTVHLPANAKGLVFTAESMGDIRILRYFPNNARLLAELPPPLRAERFSIIGPDGKQLDPVITPLDVHAAMGTAERSFVPRRDSACSGKIQDCAPDFTRQEGALSLEVGLRNGTLVDATEDVRRSEGLFRISPRGGMQPGTYTFIYRHENKGQALKYPVKVLVHVDKVGIKPDSAPVLLQPTGSHQTSFSPAGNLNHAVLTQTFRYAPPARYGQYAALLTYATQARQTGDPALCGGRCEQQLGPHSEQTPDTAMLATSCGGTDKPLEQFQVSGFAGLLEVEDRLHAAPVLTVSFGGKGVRCEGAELLNRALAKRGTADISALVCKVGFLPDANIVDLDNMLAILRSLTVDSDERTRRCALSSSVELTARAPQRGDSARRLARVRSLVALLVKGSGSADPRDRVDSLDQLDMLWFSLRSQGADDNTLAVLSDAVPALTRLAGNPETEHDLRFRAIRSLGGLGKLAMPSVPVLTRIVAHDQEAFSWAAGEALKQIKKPQR